jgi:hypothetical protein
VTSVTVSTNLDVQAPPSQDRPIVPRLLAVAVVAQPLLIAVNALFHPEVDMSGEGLLTGAIEGPGTWYVVHMIAAFGALLGIPAAVGLRRLVRGRGRRLADVAMAAWFVAGGLLAMGFAAEGSLLRLVTTADIDRSEALVLAEAYAGTSEFYAVGVGAAAATLGGVLFAIALLRDGRLPRWMPCTLLVGSVATAAAAPGTPVGPVAFAIITVAAVGLARRLATSRAEPGR